MQPLKLIIPGDWWDSQLYAGKLYLFGCDETIVTLDWDSLINSIAVNEDLRLALRCGFSRSDVLYGAKADVLLADTEVRNSIANKFTRLAARDLVVTARTIDTAREDVQKTPFPFPHADSTVYGRVLYVAGSDGLYRARCGGGTKHPVSSRSDRIWDAPLVDIEAGYGAIALAASDEGLFRIEIPDLTARYRDEPGQVDKGVCDECHWAFYNIYRSSHQDGGALAEYRPESGPAEVVPTSASLWRQRGLVRSLVEEGPPVHRVLSGVRSESEIFGDEWRQVRTYSWARQDKLCIVNGDRIDVVRHLPWREGLDDEWMRMGSIRLPAGLGDVLSASVALYGTILEFPERIVVIPSDGSSLIVAEGEPVNWRVFGRSVFYENQLHVVYEDRLEIWSFNHDYFVRQEGKISGTSFPPSDRPGRGRRFGG